MIDATETTEREALSEFIKRNGITMEAKRIDARPDRAGRDAGWDANASHWRCTFHLATPRDIFNTQRDGTVTVRARRRMTVYFSMGAVLQGPPAADDVFDALASDAAGMDGRTFEEWADEYGFDTDSRKAHTTFLACRRSAGRLCAFLGHIEVERLMYATERA